MLFYRSRFYTCNLSRHRLATLYVYISSQGVIFHPSSSHPNSPCLLASRPHTFTILHITLFITVSLLAICLLYPLPSHLFVPVSLQRRLVSSALGFSSGPKGLFSDMTQSQSEVVNDLLSQLSPSQLGAFEHIKQTKHDIIFIPKYHEAYHQATLPAASM